MTEPAGNAERRRQELEAELKQLAEQEQAMAEAQRRQEQEQRDAQLPVEVREQKAEIEKRAEEALEREYPPAWLPQKPGTGHPDQIIGVVVRIEPRVGPSKAFGTYSAVLEVKTTEEQEWTVWANEGGALYAQLLRLRIQPGEVIAAKYRGKKESESTGYSYHDFRLVRIEEEDQPAHPVDYDALGRDKELPALPEGDQAPAVDDDIPF